MQRWLFESLSNTDDRMPDSPSSSPQENLPTGDPTVKLVFDFHRALRDQPSTCLESFLETIDQELSPQTLWRLVTIELEYLQSSGHAVTLTDYLERYPQLNEISLDTLQPTERGASSDAQATHAGPSTSTPDAPPSAPATGRPETWAPGLTIDDFELLARLGRGGFATVFLARQTSMQRLVALKIARDLGAEPQTLAQLDHPHIVRVYDQRAVPDHGVFLLYMQYVAGGSLQDLLAAVHEVPVARRTGKTLVDAVDRAVIDRGESPSHLSPMRQRFESLSWTAAVCELGRQMANALEYARQQKVLHRDIKPGNILIGSDCVAKLADFNISFWANQHGADPRAQFGGSLAYMSPEQLRAFNPDDTGTPADLDHRSDLFSLGVVLYELWIGKKPFPSRSDQDSWTEQLRELTERRSDVSQQIATMEATGDPADPVLRSALERCLEQDPKDRFATPGELAAHLKIASNPAAVRLVYPASQHWTHRLGGSFLWVSLLVAGLVNLLGVFFVREFNLLQSIPQTHQATFWIVQRAFNWTAFPLALVVFVWLTRSAWRGLRRVRQNETINPAAVSESARALIHSGNWLALVCAFEWAAAGLLYPWALRFAGVPVGLKQGVDFLMSHSLAGISIMSITFFSLTWLALRCWLPVLMRNRFVPELLDRVAGELKRIARLITVYQVLAIVVPSLAIALLVIVGDARNKFALSVISLAGLVGIPFVYVAAQATRNLIETYLQVSERGRDRDGT